MALIEDTLTFDELTKAAVEAVANKYRLNGNCKSTVEFKSVAGVGVTAKVRIEFTALDEPK